MTGAFPQPLPKVTEYAACEAPRLPARPPARGDAGNVRASRCFQAAGTLVGVGDVAALMFCCDPFGVVMYCGTVPVGA
jgi:hypothetical protein